MLIKISDNPRFNQKVSVPTHPKVKVRNACTYTLNGEFFGFATGDVLVFEREFSVSEINPLTLVIADDDLTVASRVATSEIQAILKYFIREVQR